jgi:hypothetical protein
MANKNIGRQPQVGITAPVINAATTYPTDHPAVTMLRTVFRILVGTYSETRRFPIM